VAISISVRSRHEIASLRSQRRLVFRVIARSDSDAAISNGLRECQKITNYIPVICPFGAALRALIFLREKFMLRFARNDGLIRYHLVYALTEVQVSSHHCIQYDHDRLMRNFTATL